MKKTSAKKFSKDLNISKARGLEAVIRAGLIHEINKIVKKKKLTHEKIAELSGMGRSSVTGILSGSLQKVTIDRILKIIEAVGLEAEIKVKRAA